MNRRAFSLVTMLVGVILTLSSGYTSAQEPFYQGKVIRLVVGFAAGGGFDTYTRTVARHMPKHIPGNPGTIVENMTGAGSLIAANHIYNVAKPDGLTIGHFVGSLFLGQILGQEGIKFDGRRFEYVGVPAKDYIVCAIPKGRAVTSTEGWIASKAPLKIGGTGLGGTIDNAVKTFKAALDLPVQLVSGYKGTADVRVAIDSGELDAGCWEWGGMKVAWQRQLESGDVIVLMQAAPKAYPDLPNVPLARNLAKTDQSRKLVEIGVELPGTISRSFVLPPGTPKERVRILQKAFQDTLKDPELLVEAKKSRLDVDPVSGEEVKQSVERLFTLDPTVTTKLRDILLK